MQFCARREKKTNHMIDFLHYVLLLSTDVFQPLWYTYYEPSREVIANVCGKRAATAFALDKRCWSYQLIRIRVHHMCILLRVFSINSSNPALFFRPPAGAESVVTWRSVSCAFLQWPVFPISTDSHFSKHPYVVYNIRNKKIQYW